MDIKKEEKKYFLGVCTDIEKDIALIFKLLDRILNDISFLDDIVEESMGGCK